MNRSVNTQAAKYVNDSGLCDSVVRQARQARQVEGEVEYIDNSIDQLGNALNRLEDRLFPVLQCEPPKCGEEAKMDSLVPLAESVRRNRRRIESLHSQVEEILSRLEL